MATRTVIFDFYGTLVGPAAPTRPLAELMLALGVQLTPEIAERWSVDQLDGVEHLEASRSEEEYERWQEARWTGMLRDCGMNDTAMVPVIGAVRAQVASFRVRPFAEAAAVLDDLRRAGVTVAVCSNWHWDLDSYLAESGLLDRVDLAITSARVGARKDHPRIYAHTLEALDADPAETLFVGDSWAPDVLGPIAAGMRAVHVSRDSTEGPPLPAGAARVGDLTEVRAHL